MNHALTTHAGVGFLFDRQPKKEIAMAIQFHGLRRLRGFIWNIWNFGLMRRLRDHANRLRGK